MSHYHAVVHKDPSSAFGVSFPGVPSCFSSADTMDDVLPNGIEALELWFLDRPDLAPQSLEAVRNAAREDLAKGAFLIAVPLIRPAS
jgi:predicted RNase H-like HicB family nuclease